MQTKRVVFSRTKSGLKPLTIKYATAFAEFQKELGLVGYKELPQRESLFPYEHLIAKVTPKPDYTQITDYKEILEPFWQLSLQLRYWLQEHYRTKMQYNYTPDLLDFQIKRVPATASHLLTVTSALLHHHIPNPLFSFRCLGWRCCAASSPHKEVHQQSPYNYQTASDNTTNEPPVCWRCNW